MSDKTKKYLKTARLYGVYVVVIGIATVLGYFIGAVFDKIIAKKGWYNI